MTSRFDDSVALSQFNSPLGLRVYTSRLMGKDSSLVLHGGGNTSLKSDNVLYIKGSGWDLGNIEELGFSPVDMDVLLKMAQYETLSDTDMVKEQRA